MITPQSDNWKAAITTQPWRKPIIQAHIEGIPDIVCTEAPPDPWSKTYAITASGNAAPGTNFVTFGTAAGIAQLPDWTIIMWRKRSGSGTGHIAGAWDVPTLRGFHIEDAGGYLRARWSGGGNRNLTTTTFTTGAWEYLAVSVGGLNKTVIQGVFNDEDCGPFYEADSYATRNAWTAATPFKWFGSTGVGADGFDGSVGYCAVFNRALTIAEMRRLKYRRIDKKWGDDDQGGLRDSCVAEWRCERNAGTNVVNSRNPGTYDGTFAGDAAWASSACFSVTYRPVLAASATSGQSIEPLATRTAIQSNTLQIADTDEWLTALIASSSVGILRRNVRIFLGFDGLLESEYQCVFTGRVTDFSFGPGNVYEVSVSDAIFETKTKIGLGRGSLQSGITNVSTTAQVETGRYFGVQTDMESIYSGYVRIDDEIIGVHELDNSSASVQLLGEAGVYDLVRGGLGSTAASHSTGAVIKELIAFTGQQPAFTILALLLSSGGFYGTSSYDLLLEGAYTDASTRARRGRGAGMSPSDVAVAEIVALAAAAVLQTIDLYLEDDVDDVKDMIEREICRGAGYYLAAKPDGRLTVRSITVPTVGSVVHILTPDRTIRARLRTGEGEIVNFIQFEYDYDPLTQDMTDTYVASDVASGQKFGLRRRAYELPATAVSTDLATLASTILQRYADPTVLIEVECGCYEGLLEVGDAVLLVDFHLPNFTTGHRGVTNILCQVVDRQVDHVRGRTNLTLVDCSRM